MFFSLRNTNKYSKEKIIEKNTAHLLPQISRLIEKFYLQLVFGLCMYERVFKVKCNKSRFATTSRVSMQKKKHQTNTKRAAICGLLLCNLCVPILIGHATVISIHVLIFRIFLSLSPSLPLLLPPSFFLFFRQIVHKLNVFHLFSFAFVHFSFLHFGCLFSFIFLIFIFFFLFFHNLI